MKVLLIGSIGVMAETSELQRKAYNQSFTEHKLDWYWNVANYCELLKNPGGKSRLTNYSNGGLSTELIQSIHAKKETIFSDYLQNGILPRDGVAECLDICRAKGIRLGFITTTTQRNIDILSKALSDSIDFSQFELITTKRNVTEEKPSSEVYKYALTQFGVPPEDAIAVEDTEANQEAALKEQILCYLCAGEYAVTHHNLNAVKSLKAISNRL